MKKIHLFLILLICTLVSTWAVSYTIAYSAEPTVRYDGRKQEFYFLNITEKDLFQDLKEVVPGDKITQRIRIGVGNCQKQTEMYLRGESIDADKLPETIKLKVYQGENLISEGSLNEQGNLKDGVRLYRFTKDAEIELQVVLEIPDSIGNEVADLRKEIQWIFTINEYEGTTIFGTASQGVPKTGDKNQIPVQILLAAAALTGTVLLEKKKKW